jgi:hypothetical protein
VNGLAALSSGVHILDGLHVQSGADDFVGRSQEMSARCRFGARWLARKQRGGSFIVHFLGLIGQCHPKKEGCYPGF